MILYYDVYYLSYLSNKFYFKLKNCSIILVCCRSSAGRWLVWIQNSENQPIWCKYNLNFLLSCHM